VPDAHRSPAVSRKLWLGALLAVAAAGLLLPFLAARVARPLLVNLGPNDHDYTRGFREDWERDGKTRFHWTTLASGVRLPLRLEGEGHRLRMRVRRHFIEPAVVTLTESGRTFARFEIAADTRTPYRILEYPLPALDGRAPLAIEIHATSASPRPLGLAIDWIEVIPARPLALLATTRLQLAAVALIALGTVWIVGGGVRLATAMGLVLATLGACGVALDAIATERILREGWATFAFVSAVTCAALGWPCSRRAISVERGPWCGALAALVLIALAVRLVIVLHPGFYYPDVKVHALFAWQLARRGLMEFLRDFTANQYRYSLGLQFESGHWYAFPYPPAFYLLTWPLTAWARVRPEVAVSLVAAIANTLEALAVFAIARRLRRGVAVSLAAAACVPLLPIFIVRISLAYFPALVGHALDALVLFVLIARLRAFDRPRVIAGFAVLLAAALLTYTQSILNFAVIIPLFLVVEIARDRSWRRILGLAAASLLGVVLSLALFYGRYVPIALDMVRGVPMPEEQILIEKQEREKASRAPIEENAERTPEDPYAGPGIDPLRGMRKAAWRMWVFYGPFAIAVVLGLVLLFRALDGPHLRFAATWAATYVVLNLLSGGLPGPNLVRYNKDHEIVAPLFCVAIAVLGAWLWRRSRWLAIAYAAAFVVYAAMRDWSAWMARFVLER
jgi:hypothetical protein